SNLKYAFLGPNNTLPVIVASDLSGSQEEALLKVLSMYKAAVGWTIADLKGINPSLCMHRIVIDRDIKPSRDAHRRLNPNMKEVDVIDEEVQKHAPRMLKDDPLDLYLTGENKEILDVAEVQEIQECLVSSLDHQ
nr:putative reverse transcriptase domain, zinc finger, CCHC-type, retrotransposon Gag domain protein [Tanacetum cinerariifolium]